MKKAPLLLLAVLLLTTCGREPRMHPAGKIINQLGRYNLGGYIHLRVSKNEQHDIIGEFSEKGKVRFHDDTKGRIFERWYYLWESQHQTLWFWSSDSGGHTWKRGSDGQFTRREVLAEDARHFPAIYWENLPSSLQDRWVKYRR